MTLATWAWQLLHGSPWVLEYSYLHQMMTQTNPKPSEGFCSDFGALGGPWPCLNGLAATTWVPAGARVPVLSPNDDPNPSQSCRSAFKQRKIDFSKTFKCH